MTCGAVAFDRFRDVILGYALELLRNRFPHELGERLVLPVLDQPMNPIQVRLLGVDDCLALGRPHGRETRSDDKARQPFL